MLHRSRSTAEVPSFHASIDVNYSLDVIMVDNRRLRLLANGCKVRKKLWRWFGGVVERRRGKWRAPERLHRINHVLGHLFQNAVTHSASWIQPIVGRKQRISGERRQQVGGYRTLIDAELERLNSIDADTNGRGIEKLRDAHVGEPRN